MRSHLISICLASILFESLAKRPHYLERNRIIHCSDINDLSRCRRAILGCAAQLTAFSGMRGPKFTKLGEDEGDHCYTRSLSQRTDILLHFQMRAAES